MMMFVIFVIGIMQNVFGMGAAICFIFLIFVLILTLVQHRVVERRTHYS